MWNKPKSAVGNATNVATNDRSLMKLPWRSSRARTVGQDISALLRNYEDMNLGWFWATDVAGRLTYISTSVCEFFGTEMSSLLGVELCSIIKTKPADAEQGRTLPFILARQARFAELRISLDTGIGQRVWALSGNPQVDDRGNFAGFLGHGTDVTDAHDNADESARLAMYDPLTGLANRRRIASLLEAALGVDKAINRQCGLLLIDLDRFRQINDTLGHAAGDELLTQVASRLIRIVGDVENVGRTGGDKFQVVVQDISGSEGVADLAHKIIETLSQPYSINNIRCVIGASIGIMMSPFRGLSADEVTRNADLALHASKGSGGGRYAFFDPDMLEAAEDRRLIEDDLRDALQRQEMEVNYQPIVDTKTGEATGFEALLRWNHPQRGRISPAVFIPIAEEANLIPELGEWVLRQACQDAAKWPGCLRVAVNVSPVQFANQNLPQIVTNALAHSGLAPSRLELEITESIFLGVSDDTAQMFEALKALGVRLALDDFGTGYSSLGYLTTAPFDKIKIDQSFVRGALRKGSRNAAIIAAIVALAEAVGMETTAEGVETFDQLEMIRELKVSHIQGYLYSLPLPASDIMRNMVDGAWTISPEGPATQREHRLSTFKQIGAIHEDHYYPVMLRNLSATGALIEGICDVPIATQFVLDFGDGQLVIGTVKRSWKQQQGLEFEHPLISDTDGSMRTRNRISSLMLLRAGLSADQFKPNLDMLSRHEDGTVSFPAFRTADKAQHAGLISRG